MHDALGHTLKGNAIVAEQADLPENTLLQTGRFVVQSLFATIANASFSDDRITRLIQDGLLVRDWIKAGLTGGADGLEHDAVTWSPSDMSEYIRKPTSIGVLATENEDIRSLRELLLYGLKGIAANTSVYGNQEITEVNFSVRNNPGVMISGCDLKDMEELLEQTVGTGLMYIHTVRCCRHILIMHG